MHFKISSGPPKHLLERGAEIYFTLELGIDFRLDIIPKQFKLTGRIEELEPGDTSNAHEMSVLPIVDDPLPELKLTGWYVSARSHPRGSLKTDGLNDHLAPVRWLGLSGVGLLWYASESYGWQTVSDILKLSDVEICERIIEKYTNPDWQMSTRAAQAAGSVDKLRQILEEAGFEPGWKHSFSELMHLHS